MTISKQSTILTNFLVVTCVVLGILLWLSRVELDQERHLNELDTKHDRQLVGSTTLWKGSKGKDFTYNLRSFDDGRTWVAVEYDDDWRMKIKGDAEVLYPGLVQSIKAMHALVPPCLNLQFCNPEAYR
jgi:hypothetical protein